jgi:Nudix hydrolase domain
MMLKSITKIVVNVGSGVPSKSLKSLTTLHDISRSFNRGFSTGVEESKFTSPLPFKVLPFQSIELDAETLPVQDTSEFGSRLYSTIEKCKADGINSIFLKVPMLLSHYIPVAG